VEGDKGAAARKEGAAGKEGNDKSELPPPPVPLKEQLYFASIPRSEPKRPGNLADIIPGLPGYEPQAVKQEHPSFGKDCRLRRDGRFLQPSTDQ